MVTYTLNLTLFHSSEKYKHPYSAERSFLHLLYVVMPKIDSLWSDSVILSVSH